MISPLPADFIAWGWSGFAIMADVQADVNVPNCFPNGDDDRVPLSGSNDPKAWLIEFRSRLPDANPAAAWSGKRCGIIRRRLN
jgi:hypothetical protein